MFARLQKPQPKRLVDSICQEAPLTENCHTSTLSLNGAYSQPGGIPHQYGSSHSGELPIVQDLTALYAVVRTEAAPILQQIAVRLMALDDAWQGIVRRHIDPLFGGQERNRQFSELNIGIGTPEKDANRRMGLAVINLGVAWTATHLFWPLAVANIAFSTWLAWPLYQRGFQKLKNQRQLSYPLVLISSEFATYLGGYFMPASVGILFAMTTQKLFMSTEHHFRREFLAAFGPQPRKVWAVVDGVEMEVPFETVARGDILVIDAGQIMPVDGVVTSGLAMVDQHMLTGESQPAEKAAGDPVLAATLVLSGKIYVCVEKAGAETNAAQIAAILQKAVNYRLSFISRVQNFNDRMVAPLLGLGALAWLTLGGWAAAAITGVGVGMVARVGGPMAMLSYMNVASRRGILVKDAHALEVFQRVDTIVFDKTGTLTLEQPQVCKLHLQSAAEEQSIDAATLLCYAATAEARQSHPIAKAILAAAAEARVELLPIADAHYRVGFGIQVLIDGKVVRVGSQRFMESEQLAVPATLAAQQEACHAQGHSLVLVAVDEQVVGAIELEPTIRPDAKATMATLREQGLDLYIISGDHEAPTRHLAEQLGIDHYYAGVLPQDKAALVEALAAQGRTVCFVGDGINDAIALSKAEVSVSLRGATTIATDTAQIVLMGQELQQLVFLREIATQFGNTLQKLFRLTVIPVSVVVAGTFLIHTGIYFSILAGGIGFWSGVGVALQPLRRYKSSELVITKTAHQQDVTAS